MRKKEIRAKWRVNKKKNGWIKSEWKWMRGTKKNEKEREDKWKMIEKVKNNEEK